MLQPATRSRHYTAYFRDPLVFLGTSDGRGSFCCRRSPPLTNRHLRRSPSAVTVVNASSNENNTAACESLVSTSRSNRRGEKSGARRRSLLSNSPVFLSPCLRLCPSGTQTVINTMCGFGVQTKSHREANKSIYPVGCVDKAVVWIESHLLLVGALALGLALPQVRRTLLQSAHSISAFT